MFVAVWLDFELGCNPARTAVYAQQAYMYCMLRMIHIMACPFAFYKTFSRKLVLACNRQTVG